MKRYAVVFEESAQADVRDSYEWVAVFGESAKHNNGCDNFGQQFLASLLSCRRVSRLHLKMMNSRKRFVRW